MGMADQILGFLPLLSQNVPFLFKSNAVRKMKCKLLSHPMVLEEQPQFLESLASLQRSGLSASLGFPETPLERFLFC